MYRESRISVQNCYHAGRLPGIFSLGMSRTLLEGPGLTELARIIHKDNECGLADVKSSVVLVPEFAVWTMACSQSNKGAAA
jgi:hypothetical protein